MPLEQLSAKGERKEGVCSKPGHESRLASRQHQAAGAPKEVNYLRQVTLLSCLFVVTVQADMHKQRLNC